jgi:hypothetical protein
MAQAIINEPLNARGRVRSQDSQYGVCGGLSGKESGSPPSTVIRFSPVGIVPKMLQNQLSVTDVM